MHKKIMGGFVMAAKVSAFEASLDHVECIQQVGSLLLECGLKDPEPPDLVMKDNLIIAESHSSMEMEQYAGTTQNSSMVGIAETSGGEGDAVIQEASDESFEKQFKSTFRRFRKKYGVGVAAILEPRVSGDKALKIIRSLEYPNYIISEANGFAGGVWIVWDPNEVSVTLEWKQDQFIHCWVEFPGKEGFFWTAVYASPKEEKRSMLWEDLKLIGRTTNSPWMLSGDFNEISSVAEKKGGKPVDVNRCIMFNNVLNACVVIDLGEGGNIFTWKGPKFPHLDRVLKRLDRAVANDAWRTCFEEATVLNLPRIFSDHCPVLVRLDKENQCWRDRPFRFMVVWQNDSRFNSFIKTNWDPSSKLLDSLTSFTPAVRSWNMNVFGFTHYRKNRLADILEQKEQIWYLKSRGDWIKGGDRNTRYYHTCTLIRRKKNKIIKLQNHGGGWISGEEELIDLARNFFINLFTDDLVEPGWSQTSCFWPAIREDHKSLLSLDISLEEVKKAFFQMAPLKTPGPDGYPALFYHKNWELIKEQVFNSMKFYLSKPEQIKEINQTLFTLIPKVDRPCFMKQFRPIALCNTVYKGLSKILVNKIKSFIGELVSPNQVIFIPKRNIQDNIIIVQELIHSMHRTQGKKSYFSIKIDLEKAYDKLRWSFVKTVLEELKLPGELIAAIMGCVTSPYIEVLWNGSRTQGFYPQRGLRQGDPVSPYLFVLCMEKLTHLIMDEVDRKAWHPIRAGRAGPQISHLMFADDIILFAEASLSQMECITGCLEKFSRMSGQCVSMEKSCIYFSKNTTQEIVSTLADASGFKVVKGIGCYLGTLMRHGRTSRQHYSNVIGRVQNRLQGWKTKCLSLAGRITLTKSVISAMPMYHMQNNSLPIHVCQEIEKLQRNFIWGDSYAKRKAHYVAWEQLYEPKECGGLGIINLRVQNEAFMQKRAWMLINKLNSLWSRDLLGKYGRKHDPRRGLAVKNGDSSLWKSICAAHVKLDQHLTWEMGNGNSVFFWTDCWHGWKENLYELAFNKPCTAEKELKVIDIVDQVTGAWQWDYLKNYLEDSTLRRLQNLQTPCPNGPEDRICWLRSSLSCSLVRNAYQQLLDVNLKKDKVWTLIWKWKGPIRIATFMWLACLNKLPVRSSTSLWNGGEILCPSCLSSHETLMHVLRDCLKARKVWERWFGGKIPDAFMLTNDFDWFRLNICNSFSTKCWHLWKEAFFVTCWMLWQWRNLTVHEELFDWPSDPMSKILLYLRGMKSSCCEDPFFQKTDLPFPLFGSGYQEQKEVLKIFVDGTVNLETNAGACGGLICTWKGDWISGFSFKIGCCSIFEAELWGIWQGLKLASELKIKKVWLGSDSKEVLSYVANLNCE
ncbi:uncharacterized protein LOC133288347 [Gastrolobium bilobum]|uniref:uncharacterized protein LOC133288347 n=1 Tax=Gastrolobium bilobum TaxID=150636 RepID=UPI002AAF2177|nr:uncharacterized protein LOC133288347 [Gastrolobium bilobum]